MAQRSLPQRIDRYELVAAIGEGGMATVYHARFVAPGGATKHVALKLMHEHLGRERDFVRMFRDEMRVAMAMSHRNVVQTFDAGQSGAQHYLVMELLNRGSLGRLLRDGKPLPLDVVLLVAMDLCAALDYAHHLQPAPVIHRDVSPGNVLLSDQGDVKLADFGVAKAARQLATVVGGTIKGKLGFMAPEQAQGEAQPRSDVFALGAVLFRLLSGSAFRRGATLEEVRASPARVVWPPGSERVPLALQQLVGRCLRREPAERPSAAEVRSALAAELELLQLRTGAAGDALQRLRAFFAALPPVVSDAPGGDPKAAELRQAMMRMALAVPTDHGLPAGPALAALPTEVEPTPALDPSLPSVELSLADVQVVASPASGAQTAAPATPARRRWPWLAAAAALLLVAAASAWLLVGQRQRPARRADAGPKVAVLARPAAAAPDAAAAQAAPDAAPIALDASALRPARRATRAAPPASGQLDLNAAPWAKVYVDGRYLGATPLQGVRLPAGWHRVRLVSASARSAELRVRIVGGRTTRRWVRLEPR